MSSSANSRSRRLHLLAGGLATALLLVGCRVGEPPTASAEPSTPSQPTGETALPGPTDTPSPEPSPTREPFEPTFETVSPEPLAGYVPNPYMGWQNTQELPFRFTETIGYNRFNWSDLNPARGEYDWSLIEALRETTRQEGALFHFRVRTTQPPPFGPGQVMPDWLVEEGALIWTEDPYSTEPLYHGCLFLEAHAEFIDNLRERYDGDPDLAFLDIGSYGYFGEWNTSQYDWDEPGSLDWHARRRIADMYIGGSGTRPCLNADGSVQEQSYQYMGFQSTQLIMGYTPHFEDPVLYVMEQRQDVGLRQDSLGSESHQETYQERMSETVSAIWPRVPIVFEMAPDSYTPEALARAREFAQLMHVSLIHDNLDGQGDDALLEELLAVIGYRLVLREITYSSTVQGGSPFTYRMTWENAGVAPPYYVVDPIELSLVDGEGQSIFRTRVEVDVRTWLPGDEVVLGGDVPFPDEISPGTYDLRVAFVDADSGAPTLNLAVVGDDGAGRYQIGSVEVVP